MKFIKPVFFILIALSSFYVKAATSITVNSPHQIVQLKINQQADGSLLYSVNRNDKQVILPSNLCIKLNKPQAVLNQFNITSIDSSAVNDSWQPVWGELKEIKNNYKQVALTLSDKKNSGIIIKIIFRVFDDGTAFRYEFPEQKNLKYFIVSDEATQFKLTGDHKTFWIPGDYDSNEFRYNTTKLSEVNAIKAEQNETGIGVTTVFSVNGVQTPLMMKTSNGLYINMKLHWLIILPCKF